GAPGARRIARRRAGSARGSCRSSAANMAATSPRGSGPRWRPSTWRPRTGSSSITKRCGGGCLRPGRRGRRASAAPPPPPRRRRERRARFGELVQLDGSFHPWFEDRGPQSCLLTLVDDATGRSLGRFGAQETIWAAVGVLRAWIAQYGVPQALYTDWKNVYVRRPNQEERDTGAEPLTQFGRMCAALGITIIPASSPQAKGRIERNHGTHQDRLVKKLRRQGLADVETANRFLATEYWVEHNRRFAQTPASPDDFHVAVPRGVQLGKVFR